MVLYTDGLYEVENQAGELYDQPMLVQSIEHRTAEPTDGIFDHTIREVQEYSGTPTFTDDVCLVGVEICAVGVSVAAGVKSV